MREQRVQPGFDDEQQQLYFGAVMNELVPKNEVDRVKSGEAWITVAVKWVDGEVQVTNFLVDND